MLKAISAVIDPRISTQSTKLPKIWKVLGKFRFGMATGICKISAELLQKNGYLLYRELPTVTTNVWKSGRSLLIENRATLFRLTRERLILKIVVTIEL